MFREERRTTIDRLRRATCLMNARQFDAAVAELVDVTNAPVDFEVDALEWFFGNRRAGLPSVSQLRALIADDSENPELHFQLGLHLAWTGRFDEAELRFTQTVSIERTHVEALVGLGLCRSATGDHEGAVSILRRAQATRPNDPKISLLLAKNAGSANESGVIMDLCATVAVD